MPTTPTRAPGSIQHHMRMALHDVESERLRQVRAEGWTPSHDDEHTDGELACAAACYAMPPDLEDRSVINIDRPNVACPPDLWPWGPEAWKPTTRRRELVKAAALILAEIERIDRAATPKPGRYRDTDGTVGTLSEFDAFANCYTFTPDGHRPPAVIPDTQPAHLRSRSLGREDVQRLEPFELGRGTDAADHIEWKATHAVVVGGTGTQTAGERLRDLAAAALRLSGFGQGAVVGIAPKGEEGCWLCLDPTQPESMADQVLDNFDGADDDDVIVVQLGVAPVGTLEALDEFDGW